MGLVYCYLRVITTNFIPSQYSCCGQLGAHDYILMGRGIPLSCYKDQERREYSLFSGGCLQAVQAHATDNVAIGLIIKWLLLLVEVCRFHAGLGHIFPRAWLAKGGA